MRKIVPMCAAVSLAVMAPAAFAQDPDPYGISDQVQVLDSFGGIHRLNVESGVVSGYVSIKGLLPGEKIHAIESANFHLYGVSEQRIYQINTNTGDAVPIGPRSLRPLFHEGDLDPLSRFVPFAFAIHPGPGPFDRPARALILIGSGGRLEPATSNWTQDASIANSLDFASTTLTAHDPLGFVLGDAELGPHPVVLTCMYAEDPLWPGVTALFGVDHDTDTLVRIGAAGTDPSTPEGRIVHLVGRLTGLAAGQHARSMATNLHGTPVLLTSNAPSYDYSGEFLYRVDLETGALTQIKDLGFSLAIDIATRVYATPRPLVALDVTRARGSVDFKKRNRNALTLRGTIEIPETGWEGVTLRADVGGTIREFLLDARGRGTSGRDSFRVSGRPRDGKWQYTLTVRGGDLESLGIASLGSPTGTVGVVTDLILDGPGWEDPLAHRAQLEIDYFVRKGTERAVVSKHAP